MQSFGYEDTILTWFVQELWQLGSPDTRLARNDTDAEFLSNKDIFPYGKMHFIIFYNASMIYDLIFYNQLIFYFTISQFNRLETDYKESASKISVFILMQTILQCKHDAWLICHAQAPMHVTDCVKWDNLVVIVGPATSLNTIFTSATSTFSAFLSKKLQNIEFFRKLINRKGQ